jgi:uncharacterized protein (DUF1697 family)
MEFAVLLRGINVGGHNRIKMAELRALLEAEGLANVSTYIQSGNVRVSSSKGAAAVRDAVIAALLKHGIKNPQMAVVAWSDLEKLVAAKPYEGHGDEWRKLALFTSSPLASPQELVGEHGLMRVISARPDVYFTLSLKEATPGMKGIDNLEKVHRIPVTGRFWNVIEDWVALPPQG